MIDVGDNRNIAEFHWCSLNGVAAQKARPCFVGVLLQFFWRLRKSDELHRYRSGYRPQKGAPQKSIPGDVSKPIQRDLQISPAVALGLGQPTAIHVHLESVEDQLRHGKCAVASLPKIYELILGTILREVNILGLLLGDGAFPARFPPPRLVVMAGEDPGFIRQR